MEKTKQNVIISVLGMIINNHTVIKATKYVSANEVIRVTRRIFGGKVRKGNLELILTIGKPNYAEREFIKKWKKAKEQFPIDEIQLKEVKLKNK